MAGRRRHARRRSPPGYGYDAPITIRIGSRRSANRYHEMQATGPRDAGRFARLVDDQVRMHPDDPLMISINGHQNWLSELLGACFEDYWEGISELSRELQFAGTAQFPEKASMSGQYVPWTFITDQINVPEVYYWSVGMEPPESDEERSMPVIEQYRMRVGVWSLGRGACRFDRGVSTTLIFTRNTPVAEHVVGEIMFPYLYANQDLSQPRGDEEGVCFIFIRLYWLLTDWQNILRALITRLDEAEINSHGQQFPVKLRTRTMHIEVDRIYELKDYLRFHSRSFKKLKKLQTDVPVSEQKDPLWDDMDDSIDDLEQFDSKLDSLKERFNNLLDLEFNIQNAEQSDDSSFLTTVATLFLPISFLASVFGITTITWPAIYYLYVALPILVLSCIFVFVYPITVRRYQKARYGLESTKITLRPRDFTMLGKELPDGVDLPGESRTSRLKNRAQRHSVGEKAAPRSRSRARSQSRLRGEKDGSYSA
ncbi:hypothetical protein B0A48_07441 [Cryoendolithus antarcticus]|uniref:Uncharacterized protein n=1 Tax=Cryoendolithus antarcticus TaxID=1507870 RepID=A0A1V8T637_9PEZI|nr:hypothetical protein B0A48_07441 [Cryoendolithus antarcticus]